MTEIERIPAYHIEHNSSVYKSLRAETQQITSLLERHNRIRSLGLQVLLEFDVHSFPHGETPG